jgi:rhamnose transport system permease protein
VSALAVGRTTAVRSSGTRVGFLRQKEAALVVLLLLTASVAALTLPQFRTSTNLLELANQASIVIVVGVAQAVVMIGRQIDISISAILGICAFVVGRESASLAGAGLGLPVALATALAIGGLLGLVNGLLVAALKMPALIATLATLAIYGGFQVVIVQNHDVFVSELPPWLAQLQTTYWLGVGALIWIAVLTAAAIAFVMSMTRWGRDVYAVGSNPQGAADLGIPVFRRTCEVFVVCGAISGLAGVVFIARYGNVSASAGTNFNLTAIAAAVVGGVSLFGGSGTPLGAALAAVLLVEVEQVIAILSISNYAERTVQGAAIVLYVVLYSILGKRLHRVSRPDQGTPPPLDGGVQAGEPGGRVSAGPQGTRS